jgi:hypothetical protein
MQACHLNFIPIFLHRDTSKHFCIYKSQHACMTPLSLYIWCHYSSPRVMDQRYITWTQQSNWPNELGAPPRPRAPRPPARPRTAHLTLRVPPAHPPAHPFNPAPPAPTSSILADRPRAACPPDLAPLHTSSHASPADERLLPLRLAHSRHRWVPLSPPPSASPVGAPAVTSHP